MPQESSAPIISSEILLNQSLRECVWLSHVGNDGLDCFCELSVNGLTNYKIVLATVIARKISDKKTDKTITKVRLNKSDCAPPEVFDFCIGI